jgi:hypothetical protein
VAEAVDAQELLARRGRGQVFLLGCPKSGTSAVASLLADHAGLSKTIDIPSLWQPHISEVLRGRRTLRDVVLADPAPFAAGLVKEPNLTLLLDQVRALFPEAQLVFLVRHPVDNVRSILDRAKVPGDRWLMPMRRMPARWRKGFDRELAGSRSGNYVAILAAWWARCVDMLERHGDGVHLLRYEDFRQDKAGQVAALAGRLGLERRGDISAKLDVQYQPKGKADTDVRRFFGWNLRHLRRETAGRLDRFGYSLDLGARVGPMPPR